METHSQLEDLGLIMVKIIMIATLLSGCSFSGIFFPLDQRPDELVSQNKQVFNLTSKDGLQIQYMLFTPKTTEVKVTILAFHGSGSKVVNWVKVYKPLIDHGYQVLMMEYRGFGQSKG